MILGDVCTRRCGFCHVAKGKTRPIDSTEPQRLAEAGVPTLHSRYDGVVHGFVSMYQAVDKGQEALDLCGKRLREFFAS